ncbi:hypothetical protein PILCRDRAFT_701696 [Piloderma croceum F 1598]|uniref:Uncharacterized protein n=1 Tax=Piloderma croceum (strain F 1598) TaxID=765440 RepID=A0A0C3F3Q7_PILCF|nr:hypothetical protein PILCRDRAFT_701696 [Piloderma croceum F 1598]
MHSGLVLPPCPWSLSASSNRPMQRKKQSGSSQRGGRSTSVGIIDLGAESASSTTFTHPADHTSSLSRMTQVMVMPILLRRIRRILILTN